MFNMDITISAGFDGGNIRVINKDTPEDIQLEIRKDAESNFYQWFYFRVTGAQGDDLKMRIVNAKGAAFEKGWPGYQAVASYDRQNWFRVDTRYENGELIIEHMPMRDSVYFAYFAPYSMDRHAELVANAQIIPGVSCEVLGQTLDGQDLDLLIAGEGDPDKPVVWVIARQHPGETMAEWFMEGFINRLLDPQDAIARQLLARFCFYLVPNMNPDGSRRGHLRTNAAGANLNREWMEPTLERSPEVYHVRQRMHETGMVLCLDVHGDEALPYNFIAGCEGAPSYTDKQETLISGYKNALMRANPDFQTKFGYPRTKKGEGNLTMCTNYTGETFGAVSMTLEQPFKDTADSPMEGEGWSPERAIKLGASNLDALYAIMDDL